MEERNLPLGLILHYYLASFIPLKFEVPFSTSLFHVSDSFILNRGGMVPWEGLWNLGSNLASAILLAVWFGPSDLSSLSLSFFLSAMEISENHLLIGLL